MGAVARETTPIALNVNFDSLSEAFGFPAGFRDPSFFEGFDRLAELAGELGAPLTLYVVARDLEHPEVFARVREWAQAGHEVGSHSYSHPGNLGAMPPQEMRDEVGRAHDLIAECIGAPPKGFIAPSWSTSPALLRLLRELGYRYDSSLFPSLALYPVMAKVALNHWRAPERFRRIVRRGDWTLPLSRPLRPFLSGPAYRPAEAEDGEPIVVLPMPSRTRLSFPLWHTVGFLFGWRWFHEALERYAREVPYFYYLMHPADFTGAEDVDSRHRHALERFEVPLPEKLARLRESLQILKASGRPFRRMHELADAVRAEEQAGEGRCEA